MTKILVTGSSGFIGQAVMRQLAKHPCEVYPFHIALSDQAQNRRFIKQVKGNLLLHLAWETTPQVYWHSPINLDWLKVSLDVIETFALSGGQRVVIAGSCAEITPHTLYGATKESLRLCAEAFLRKQGVSCAWGRLFSPYGPREKERRLIPSLIHSLLAGRSFHCDSQKHIRDFIYVDDVADALVSTLLSSVEGVIDIGHGVGTEIGEVVRLIGTKLSALDQITFASSVEREDNPSALLANINRLINEVGFKPKYSLNEGIDKMIHSIKNGVDL